MQRVSCALMRGVAWELATAMELTRSHDPREDGGGGGGGGGGA